MSKAKARFAYTLWNECQINFSLNFQAKQLWVACERGFRQQTYLPREMK